MARKYEDLGLNNLDIGRSGPVLTVTFNRPQILNPLDFATLHDLGRVLELIGEDPEVEILVIRGSGRAFSAGGDLKKHLTVHQDFVEMAKMNDVVHKTLDLIGRTDRLVIAIVDGLCVAGGIEVMTRCDIVIASEEASFSDGHLNVSLLPGGGGTQIIPRLINPLRAKLFMLTAKFISGRQAADIGLVSACYPRHELEDRVEALLKSLLEKSFSARAAIKYLVNQSMSSNLENGINLERHFVEHYESTHRDAREGLVAFSEKRKPRYQV